MDQIEKQKMIDVDGVSYKVHLLPPTRALKTSVKLTKMIAEPMAAMAGTQKFGVEKVLPMAVKALVANLDDDATIGIVKDVVSTVSRDNKQLNFEVDFHGRLGHLVDLVAKVMEIQFGDFFAALRRTLESSLAEGDGETGAA